MKVGNVYQCCNRCVMDTTADDIHFDETGNCNYCSEFLSRFRPFSMQSMEFKKAALDNLVKRIKKVSRGKNVFHTIAKIGKKLAMFLSLANILPHVDKF